ncbi:MAG: alpha/beta hydrolase [Chloroflexi bacterium]|nr:alpha/beta hydrolase [Chloroflexota bacterium]
MAPFEIPLWPDGPTYSFKPGGEETWSDDDVMPRPGVVNRVVRRVSHPTLTIYPAPADKATGTAVIIAPGGGYVLLAIDKEGYDVAQWLNSFGVTGIVLKYRVRPDPQKGMGLRMDPGIWGAILSDGKRAVRTVRARAAEWGINPNRIGMIGFSAGSHLTASVTLNSDPGDESSPDPIERVSCRPDFIGLLYGAFAQWPEELPSLPPLFMMQANDDRLFADPEATWLRFVKTWTQAGVPFEVHHYAKGGHGFGMGVYGGAVASWPEAFRQFMVSIGVLG